MSGQNSGGLEAPFAPHVLAVFHQMGKQALAVSAAIETQNDQGICTIADRAEHSVVKNLCLSIRERLDGALQFNKALKRRLARTSERLAKECD